MERFNYKKLKEVWKEDAAILMLLDAESYGDRMDQEEEIAEMKARLESQGR